MNVACETWETLAPRSPCPESWVCSSPSNSGSICSSLISSPSSSRPGSRSSSNDSSAGSKLSSGHIETSENCDSKNVVDELELTTANDTDYLSNGNTSVENMWNNDVNKLKFEQCHNFEFKNEQNTDTVNINKTTLNYSNAKNKLKYEIPKNDLPSDFFYKDQRDLLQVFHDLILKINHKIKPELAAEYQEYCQYNIMVPQVSKNGIHFLREDMNRLLKDFKRNKEFKSSPLIADCEKLLKNTDGSNIPDAIKNAGYHVIDNNDATDLQHDANKNANDAVQEVNNVSLDYPNENKDNKNVTEETIYMMQQLQALQDPAINNFLSKVSRFRTTLNKRKRKQLKQLFLKNYPNDAYITEKKGCSVINVQSLEFCSLPYLSVTLGTSQKCLKYNTLCLLDSGCDANIANFKILKSLNLGIKDLKKVEKLKVKVADGSSLNAVMGSINLNIFIKANNSQYSVNSTFLILNNQFDLNDKIILGNSFLSQVKANLRYSSHEKWLSAFLYDMNEKLVQVNIKCSYQAPTDKFSCHNMTAIADSASPQDVDVDISDIRTPGLYHVTSSGQGIQLMQDVYYIDNDNQEIKTRNSCFVWPVKLNDRLSVCVCSNGNEFQPNSIKFNFSKCSGRACNHNFIRMTTRNNTNENLPDANRLPSKPNQSGLPPVQPTENQSGWPPNENQTYINNVTSVSDDYHQHQDSGEEKLIQHLRCNHTSCQDNNTNEDCICPKSEVTSQEARLFNANKVQLTKQGNAFEREMEIEPSPENIDESYMKKIDLLAEEKVEEKLNLNHLPQKTKSEVKKLVENYQDAFASEKKKRGNFRYFAADIEVKDPHKAKQKNRNVNFSKAKKAEEKVLEMIEEGVFEECDTTPEAIANFVLVPKPKTGSRLRSQSKAAKIMAARDPEATLNWRLCLDLTSLNGQVTGNHVVKLPTVSEVKDFIKDKITSSFDVADGFTSIRVSEKSKKVFNLYFQDRILTISRLAMGLRTSPFIFVQAMKATLHDDILKEFVSRKGWSSEDFPYTSFSEFLLYYIDDLLLSTFSSGGSDLHLKAMECLFYAMERAGLLLSPGKAQIMVSSDLHFLGHTFNSLKGYSEMDPERVSAILEFRRPHSRGELSSFLGFVNFAQEYLPFLRIVSFPLHNLVNQPGPYKWGKVEEEAFTEIKLLAALRVRNSIFRPELPQFLFVDSSKIASGYFLAQLTPNGHLEIVQTGSTLLSRSAIRSPSVVREGQALVWAVGATERYILAAENSFNLVSDCSCLIYIQRNKMHHSRFFEYSVALSMYPSLSVTFLPGRFNCGSDAISRQFHNVFISGQSSISEKMSRLIPPIPKQMKDKVGKLSHEELSQFLLSEPRGETLDIWDKRLLYSQPEMTNSELVKHLNGAMTEEIVFNWISRGWENKDLYSVPVIKEIIGKQSKLSKTTMTEIVKSWKLHDIQAKLEKLNVNPSYFLKLKKFSEVPKANTQVNAVMTRSKKLMQKDQDTPCPDKKITSSTKPNQSGQKRQPTKENQSGQKRPQPTNENQSGQHCYNSKPISQPNIVSKPNQPGQKRQPTKENQSGQKQPHPTNENQSGQHCYNSKPIANQSDQPNIVPEEPFRTSPPHMPQLCLVGNCCHSNWAVQLFGKNEIVIKKIIKLIYELTQILDSETSGKIGTLLAQYERSGCHNKKLNIFLELFPLFLSILSNDSFKIQGNSKKYDIYFYIYFIECNILSYKIFQSKIEFYFNKTIDMQPFEIRQIDIKLFLSIKTPILICKDTFDDIYIELQYLDCAGFHINNILLFNLTDQYLTCNIDRLLFSLSFQQQTKQFVPIQVESDLIQNRLQILNNLKFTRTLQDWNKIFYEYTNHQNVQITSIEIEPQQQHQSKQQQQISLKQSNEDWCRSLNSLLIAKSIAKNSNILGIEELKNLQDSDEFLRSMKIKCQFSPYKGFFMDQQLLFFRSKSENNTINNVKLCIPASLTRLLMNSYHMIHNIHLSSHRLVTLISNIFYCPNIDNIAKSVLQSCLVCTFNSPKIRHKIYGSTRTLDEVDQIGCSFYVDVCVLPRTRQQYDSYIGCVLYVELISCYTMAFPIKNVSSRETAKTLYNFLLCQQSVKTLALDMGPEFEGCFSKLAQQHQILLHTPVPCRSQINGKVEVMVKFVKEELCKIVNSSIPDIRNNWCLALVEILNLINCQRIRDSALTRRSMFYSPLHYSSEILSPNLKYLESQASQLHYHSLNKVRSMRRSALKRLSTDFTKRPFDAGQIVKLDVGDDKVATVDGSKALLPTCQDIFKILQVQSGGVACRVKSLITGNEKTVASNRIKFLDPHDIIGLKLRADDLFKHVSSNRINNRFKQLNTGVSFQPENSINVSQISCLSSCPGKSILKVKTTSVIENLKNKYSHSEEKYLLQALRLAQECGYSLSSDNIIFLNSKRTSGQYKNIFPTDKKCQKSHKKKVSFHPDTKENVHLREVNVLYLYSAQSEIFQCKFNTSKSELSLLI